MIWNCFLKFGQTCYTDFWLVGTTRDHFEGKKVVRLEYEAYESQALAEMKKICALIREKWSVHGIAMLHRIGLVPGLMTITPIVLNFDNRNFWPNYMVQILKPWLVTCLFTTVSENFILCVD